MVEQEARRSAARLGSAPLGFGCSLRFLNQHFTFGSGNAVQDFVRGVLNTRTGAMEPARRFGRELAKGVAITQCVDCFKN
jgi:hypothetical protein